MSMIMYPPGASRVLSKAETIPAVIVSLRPNGLPIAASCSPTLRLEEFPSATGYKVVTFGFTFITAKSL